MVLKSARGSSGRTRIISWELISSGGMSFQGLSLVPGSLGLLLTLAIIGMPWSGLFYAVIAMSISIWTGYARIIRGMTISFREMEFIEAAKCLGASDISLKNTS
jgi:ABC-type dipeptide/oligopeptide/nickel transport system permease subunit